MPMAPFTRLDFTARIPALRAVGTALGVPAASMPAANSSGTDLHSQYWLAKYCGLNSLPNPYSVDHSSFVTILNQLVALVP
jgi:hypothetical protein